MTTRLLLAASSVLALPIVPFVPALAASHPHNPPHRLTKMQRPANHPTKMHRSANHPTEKQRPANHPTKRRPPNHPTKQGGGAQ